MKIAEFLVMDGDLPYKVNQNSLKKCINKLLEDDLRLT
jgi:hypothetical protein